MIVFCADGTKDGPPWEASLMALLHIAYLAYDAGVPHSHEAPRPMSSIPHPKRELLKLCARIGYTPH